MEKSKDQLSYEILLMAKELVLNEYTDRRANLHNKWLADSEFIWRTKKLRLPYPMIPPYPTEQDILNRAKSLLNFLQLSEINDLPTKSLPQPEPVVEANIKIDPVPSAINTYSNISEMTEYIEDNPQPSFQEPGKLFVSKNVSTDDSAGDKDNVDQKSNTMVTSVLKKLGEIKNNFVSK